MGAKIRERYALRLRYKGNNPIGKKTAPLREVLVEPSGRQLEANSIGQGESRSQLPHTLPDLLLLVNIFYVKQYLADHVGNVGQLRLAHASGGHGWTADAYPAGLEWGTCFERDSFLVDRDAGFVEGGLAFLAGHVT